MHCKLFTENLLKAKESSTREMAYWMNKLLCKTNDMNSNP